MKHGPYIKAAADPDHDFIEIEWQGEFKEKNTLICALISQAAEEQIEENPRIPKKDMIRILRLVFTKTMDDALEKLKGEKDEDTE